MIKHALFGLMLAGSTAAVAQSTQPTTDPLAPSTPSTSTPSGTSPATPAVPATPADPATGTSATPATPATPAIPSETAATQPAAPTDAAGIVAADWATYDANSNKQLSRAEFGKWVTALQTSATNKAPTQAYLSEAFKTADTNKSGGVSRDELVKFLTS